MTYIHVVDLARGHVLAVKNNAAQKGAKSLTGTGIGYSVLDLVKAFISENGVDIPIKLHLVVQGISQLVMRMLLKQKEVLGWVAEKNLNDMVRDSMELAKEKSRGLLEILFITAENRIKELLWSCYYGRNGRISA